MGMKKIIQIDRGGSSKDKSGVSFTKFEKKEKPEDGSEVTEKIVYDALREVNDPELPVNIVDLGLIYDTKISGRNIQVKMTLTTPGCGMGAQIAGQAEMALKNAGANNVLIEVIWDPPWNPDMISEEGKKKLGIT
jgi:metal-sulfur cluster biosynthetic enzyme